MIISPPCLDCPQGDQSDHDWLNAIVPNTALGAYPETPISPTLQGWFLLEGKEKNKANLVAGLKIPENQQRLAKTICQFPSEWDKSKIDVRYGWWKTKGPMNPDENVFSEESYAKLKTKLELLCFWEKTVLKNNTAFSLHDKDPNRAQWDTELEQDKLWHFHPRELIEQMRKCGWLSEREMLRCMPAIYQTNLRGRDTPVVSRTFSTEDARLNLKKEMPQY